MWKESIAIAAKSKSLPKKEMHADLDRERVIVAPDALQERELPELRIGPSARQPALENPSAQQILDPPHRHLPLLLHRLVIIRRHENPPSATASRAKELALHHQSVQPVPIFEIVAVHQTPQIPHVEIRFRGDLWRRILQTDGRFQRRKMRTRRLFLEVSG